VIFDVELVARRAERSAGEPHLYVRRASDGSTALELHGEAAIASGSFALTPELGGPYQVALFVTNFDEGDFGVNVRQQSSCSTDRDAAEPNEDPASASGFTGGLHSGTVCNRSMSFDRDYFTVPVGGPDRVLRAGLEHVPAYGPLTLVVEGPFGPLEQTRTQMVGRSLSDDMVTVAIDRVAETAPEFGAYLVGVWSDQLYNVYTLMTCLDDGLDDDSGSIIGNNDADSAVSVAIGTTYERAVLCPILGANYAAPESDDAYYYAVETSCPARFAGVRSRTWCSFAPGSVPEASRRGSNRSLRDQASCSSPWRSTPSSRRAVSSTSTCTSSTSATRLSGSWDGGAPPGG